MAIKFNQNQSQIQGLMMTPQLQQAIKLLTLTHLEMTNVIAEEMVENPMLEEFDPNISMPTIHHLQVLLRIYQDLILMKCQIMKILFPKDLP